MRRLVVLMVWSLERLGLRRAWLDRMFEVCWRVSIILLPWQTRWFHEGPMLGGYPWEGGRVSIYVSWVAMLGAIIVDFLRRDAWHAPVSLERRRGLMLSTPTMMVLFAIISSLLSTYPLATVQWWVEVILLVCFVWTVVRCVDRDDLTRWIVYAIIPHAVLGIVQHVSQMVVGSKWFGIASQNPLTPGVSIVATAGRRWLRAYGGFPHPNILGGWLVLGIGCVLRLVSLKKMRDIVAYGALTIFPVCLVLTFSRSAWFAFALLVMVANVTAFRSKQVVERRPLITACALVLAVAMATVVARWSLVVVRGDVQTRLEQRSVDERLQGWRNGVALFERHPLVGIGPRATSFALQREGVAPSDTIPVLPHIVPLLVLDEIGLVGVSFLLWAVYRYRRAFPSPSLFLPVLPLFFLDHYLWSTWSGLALAALIFTLVLAAPRPLDT